MGKFKKDFIIRKMQKNVKLAWGGGATLEKYVPGKNRNMEHVFYVDEKIGNGKLYSECLWFMSDDMVDPENKRKREEMMAKFAEQMKNMKPEDMPGPKPHTHPFDELFTFFGSDPNNFDDLNGDIDFYLEEEPVKITKSSILYIPANMRHTPVNMNRMDKSVFHFSMGFTDSYYHTVLINKGGDYSGKKGMSKYLINGDRFKSLRLPAYRKEIPESFVHRVTQINGDILPESSVNSETMWIWPESKSGIKEAVNFVDEHSHPYQQVIAFYGNNLKDIHELGGEVDLFVEGKKYKMKESFCAVIPEGVKHGPVIVKSVKSPIFHYVVGNAKKYE